MIAAPFAPVSLEVRSLSLARGGKTLTQHLSLSLAPGAALLLTGPNGAGKTTLLRALAGLFPATAGVVLYDGVAAKIAAPGQAALLGHADGLKPAETPLQSLAFWTRFYGAPADEAQAALKTMGMAPLSGRPAQRLSRGQRRRAAIARVIASNRPVWLLDEPAGPLDAAGRAALAEAVAAHRARGGLAVAATHQPLDWPGAQMLEMGR